MRIFTSFVLLSLAGCGSTQLDEEWLGSRSNSQLCESYYSSALTLVPPQRIRGELERRDALTEHEWSLVEQGRVANGFTPLAVTCAWGEPDNINRTTTAGGPREQWVFCEYRCKDASYVYFEDGRVVDVQHKREE